MEPVHELATTFQASCCVTNQAGINALFERVRSALALCFNAPGQEEPIRLLTREIVQLPAVMQADVLLWVFFAATEREMVSDTLCAEMDQILLGDKIEWDDAAFRKISSKLGAIAVDPAVVAQKLLKLVPSRPFPYSVYMYIFQHLQNPFVRELFNAILSNPLHTDNYSFLKALRKDLIGLRTRGGDIPKNLQEVSPHLSPAAFTTLLEKLDLIEEESFRLANVSPIPLAQCSIEDLKKLYLNLKKFSLSESETMLPHLIPLAEWLLTYIAVEEVDFVWSECQNLGPVTKDRAFQRIIKRCGERCLETLLNEDYEGDYLSSEKLFRFCITLGTRCSKLANWPQLFIKHVIRIALEVREGFFSPIEVDTFCQWFVALPSKEQLQGLEHCIGWGCFPRLWATLRLTSTSGTPEQITKILASVSINWPELQLRDDQKDYSLKNHLRPPLSQVEKVIYSYYFPEVYNNLLINSEAAASGMLNGRLDYEAVLLSFTLFSTKNRKLLKEHLAAVVTWVFDPKSGSRYNQTERFFSSLSLLYILTELIKKDSSTEDDLLSLKEIIKGILKTGCFIASKSDNPIHWGYLFIYRLSLFLEKVPRLQKEIYLDLSDISGKAPACLADDSENEWHIAFARLAASEMNFPLEEEPEEYQDEEPEDLLLKGDFLQFLDNFNEVSRHTPEGFAQLDKIFRFVFTSRTEFTRSLHILPPAVICSVARIQKQIGAPYNEAYASFIIKHTEPDRDKDLILWLVHPYVESNFKFGIYLFRLEKTEEGKKLCQIADNGQVWWFLCWEGLRAWAVELLLERAFESNVRGNIGIQLEKSILPFIRGQPEEYFSLRKLEILHKWCASLPAGFREKLHGFFIYSPLFPLILKQFPVITLVDLGSQTNPAQFWLTAARRWPALKAPAHFPVPKNLSSDVLLSSLFDHNMYSAKEITYKVKKLLIARTLPDFLDSRILKTHPSCIPFIHSYMSRFLSQLRKVLTVEGNLDCIISLNIATDMFELLSQALKPVDTFDEPFTKEFRMAIIKWLEVFAGKVRNQQIPATRAINAVPFILALGKIAENVPALFGSKEDSNPVDLSPLLNYLHFWENFFYHLPAGYDLEGPNSFIKDFIGLMEIPADKKAAFRKALQHLQKVVSIKKEFKL